MVRFDGGFALEADNNGIEASTRAARDCADCSSNRGCKRQMRAVTIRKQPLAGSHGLSDRDIDNRAQARVIFSHKRNRASHDRIFNRVYRLAFPSKIDPAPATK